MGVSLPTEGNCAWATPAPESLLIAAIGLSLLAACTNSQSPATSDSQSATPDPVQAAKIETVARESMAKYNLRALIVKVTKDGQDVYTGATGTSMTGVPATVDMHFRSGSFGFTYIGQIFAETGRSGRGQPR